LRQGQIYVPLTNLTLCLAVVVFTFRASSNLAAAYGIAVTGTITTMLIAFVIVLRWHWPLLVSITVARTAG